MRLPKSNKLMESLSGKLGDEKVNTQQSTRVTSIQNEDGQKSRAQLLREGKMKQLKVVIDKDIWKGSRVAVVNHELDISEVVEDLLTDWLKTLE